MSLSIYACIFTTFARVQKMFFIFET